MKFFKIKWGGGDDFSQFAESWAVDESAISIPPKCADCPARKSMQESYERIRQTIAFLDGVQQDLFRDDVREIVENSVAEYMKTVEKLIANNVDEEIKLSGGGFARVDMENGSVEGVPILPIKISRYDNEQTLRAKIVQAIGETKDAREEDLSLAQADLKHNDETCGGFIKMRAKLAGKTMMMRVCTSEDLIRENNGATPAITDSIS